MVHTDSRSPDTFSVLVIMGSVRAGRRCPQIASWVMEIAQASSDLIYELVDLTDWPLPATDESGIPARGHYTQKHTLAWSRKIAAANAFIFVTPQYNWGYPAPLKNALDHLYKEWDGKPTMIVTYGGHGGGKCAAQLKQITEALHMRLIPTMPGLTLTDGMINGGPIDPETDFRADTQLIQKALGELAAACRQAKD